MPMDTLFQGSQFQGQFGYIFLIKDASVLCHISDLSCGIL